jgi:ketosteroid isomerase-like protein
MDEERLRAIEDRLALLELEGAYARAFDSRDGDAWAGLFTEDGIYQARGATPGERGAPQGRAALADYCSHAPYDGLHLMHVPQLTIDGDDAYARVHLEFRGTFHTVDDSGDHPNVSMSGYYDVRYRRVDGEWRIAHRITTTLRKDDDVVAPYPPGTAFDG